MVAIPPAADPVLVPAADGRHEISALDRNAAPIIDLSRPHGSLATSTNTRTLDFELFRLYALCCSLARHRADLSS